MTELLADATRRFVRAAIPDPDETLREMEAYGEEFPTVGREVGQFLRLVARTVDAKRVFEFGSGYGYSAYWFAGALPPEGEVVLTDHDADELRKAREFFEQGGLADRAVFETGDALETVDEYEGPFDVVLVDHAKEAYPAAFEAVRDEVAPGGVVIADNAMTSTVQEFETILAVLEGDGPDDADEATRGVADYLTTVRSDPAFETSVLPLGEGLSVSYKR